MICQFAATLLDRQTPNEKIDLIHSCWRSTVLADGLEARCESRAVYLGCAAAWENEDDGSIRTVLRLC